MFCMRLISLHCQRNSLHPLTRGGCVSFPRALYGLKGGDE